MRDRGPGEVTTRLEIEQWPRTWFGEEKILLHGRDRAQQRRATGNEEGLPCPKTIRFRRLKRLGQNVTYSLVRLNLELKLYTPG